MEIETKQANTNSTPKTHFPNSWQQDLFGNLTTEPVQGPALPLERIDHIHGGHSLAASVLSVGNGVSDHILQEDLEHSTSLFVDEAADALHASSASQTPNGWLGDALDVVAQDLTVSLRSSLSKPLASLAAARHLCSMRDLKNRKRKTIYEDANSYKLIRSGFKPFKIWGIFEQ